MVIGDGAYEIDFLLNGEPNFFEPDTASFSVRNNIYTLFPTLSLTINDQTGVITESLYSNKGASLDVTFGVEGSVQQCKYIIKSNNIDEFIFPGTLSGEINIEAVHEWAYNQEIKSKAFAGSSDKAIREATRDYNFRSEIIESAEGNYNWYWPYINDADFIKNVVTPNANSEANPNAPFVSWIDTNNIFHFNNMQSIFNRSIESEIEYSSDPSATLLTGGKNAILMLRKISDTKELFSPTKRTLNHSIDADTGELRTIEYTAMHPIDAQRRRLPIIGNLNNRSSSYHHLYFPKDSNERKLFNAKVANQYLPSLFIDRFFVAIPLNTRIKAGSVTNFLIHSGRNVDQSEFSETYSGRYVIESVEHTWNSDEHKAFTYLVIGRRFVDAPRNYTITTSLIQ